MVPGSGTWVRVLGGVCFFFAKLDTTSTVPKSAKELELELSKTKKIRPIGSGSMILDRGSKLFVWLS